ncbi:MAG: chemotaxis protein CheW, partial [Burkholderiales bacterium]|nr:chemotaxis protein CheW [Opitutaceae bacterium]
MPAPLHLQFELGPDRYLLPVARVEAVLPLPALKNLPGAPEGVAGVADHHGVAV